MGWLSRNRYPLLALAITLAVLVIVAIIRGIAPFGKNSLLTMDLWGQYYPMIVEKLTSPFSSWSWNGSLGFSSAVQSAYYTNSLFNFLLLPFSGYARIAALDLMIFLKAALAAWSFAFYLERRSGKQTPLSTALGVAYGLSAYVIAFISQPMWLDAVIFVPLILLGLERMLAGKNPWMYVTFLALALYSNFYIGWAVCIFTVLWFFVTLISDGNRRGVKRLCADTGRFALMSGISGALCAAVLIPVVYGMKNWISSSLGFDKEIGFYHKLPQIVDNLSAGVKTSLEYGVANLFCGSAAIFFALLFLFNKKVSWSKKITYTLLAAFMLLSFELNILDFIWHGMHFPNQLPGRQSFLYVFIILLMAYETLTHLDGIPIYGAALSMLASGGILLFVGYGESKYQTGRLVSAAVIVIAFAVVMGYILFSGKKGAKQLATMALAVVISADVGASAIVTMTNYLGCADAVYYSGRDRDMRELTAKYESGKDDFWRSELTPAFTFDSGMLYGFKGITYYSSTMNGRLYTFFERLGNRVYALNVSSIYQPTPIQDMMFGVRYHYTTGGSLAGYGEAVETRGAVTVVESPYALPIAYAVNTDIRRFTTEDKTGLAAQDSFLRLATGITDAQAVTTVTAILQKRENASLFTSGGRRYFSSPNPAENSVFEFSFDVTKNGLFYLDFQFIVGDFTAKINDGPVIYGNCGRDPLKSLGEVKEGDKVTVTVTIKGYGVALYGVDGCVVDYETIERGHKKLSQNVLDVTYASNTKIRGNISLLGDMVLYSSIPAENGWSVYIDGVKQETFALDGALLCCEINAGDHTVEYRYRAPGLALGWGITAAAAATLALYYVCVWLYHRKKQNV